MKFVVLAFLGLVAATEARRLTISDLSQQQVQTLRSVKKAAGANRTLGGATECNLCVQFMDDSLNELLQIILNGGVLGSCAALCGMLPNSLEANVCNLLCDVVGVEGFIHLVQDADLDPIWMCEEIDFCPSTTCNTSCVSFKELSPGPSNTFNRGATIKWNVAFGIAAGVGASTLMVSMKAQSSNHGGNNEAFIPAPTPGFFQAEIPLPLGDPNGNGGMDAWPAGQYNSTATFCDGMCGSNHTGSGRVLAQMDGPVITIS